MRIISVLTDADFEEELQFAIDKAEPISDSGFPSELNDIFLQIAEAEGEVEPLIAVARETWEGLKESFPEDFTD